MSEFPFNLNNLKKDELYTFIAGLLVSLSWYYHPAFSNSITEAEKLNIPFLVLIWLAGTMVVYILYSFIFISIYFNISKTMTPNNDDEKEKFRQENNLRENAFYLSSNLESVKLSTHIYGLMLSTLMSSIYPLLCLIDQHVGTISFVGIIVLLLLSIYGAYKGTRETIKSFFIIHYATTNGYVT